MFLTGIESIFRVLIQYLLLTPTRLSAKAVWKEEPNNSECFPVEQRKVSFETLYSFSRSRDGKIPPLNLLRLMTASRPGTRVCYAHTETHSVIEDLGPSLFPIFGRSRFRIQLKSEQEGNLRRPEQGADSNVHVAELNEIDLRVSSRSFLVKFFSRDPRQRRTQSVRMLRKSAQFFPQSKCPYESDGSYHLNPK